jgi:hypothetical protein
MSFPDFHALGDGFGGLSFRAAGRAKTNAACFGEKQRSLFRPDASGPMLARTAAVWRKRHRAGLFVTCGSETVEEMPSFPYVI